MTTIHTPESNVDNVALNLVYDAIVDDVNNPGEAIACLLERMARMAREAGRAQRASGTDWNGEIGKFLDDGLMPDAVDGLVERMALTAGETWALDWMLTSMAKHLCEQLERRCENDPYAAHIESIEYENDGSVRAWSQRKV